MTGLMYWQRQDTTFPSERLVWLRRWCVWAQIIDDNDGGVIGGIRYQGLSGDNEGIGGEQGIDDASKGLDTTAEAEGDWK